MMTKEKLQTSPPDVRDRCDTNCGAKALVKVVIDRKGLSTPGELVFCGHHFDKMEASLLGVVFGICDTRKTPEK